MRSGVWQHCFESYFNNFEKRNVYRPARSIDFPLPLLFVCVRTRDVCMCAVSPLKIRRLNQLLVEPRESVPEHPDLVQVQFRRPRGTSKGAVLEAENFIFRDEAPRPVLHASS